MRKVVGGSVVTVRAISGTHVVFLAFNMKPRDADGLMGFAIHRTDLTEIESGWLKGNKTFARIRPSTGVEDASSHEHPFQAFQWADYAAKPGYRYRYRIIPMFGQPGALREGRSSTITIQTEPLTGGTHDVHFNRGAIASQAFARRFPGLTLEQAGPPAYAWLARDLLPGLLEFVGRAHGGTYSLRAAIYETQLPEVLQAFKQAKASGADVKIIYHARDSETAERNDAAIGKAKIRSICRPRERAKLMHNKFIVLSRNDEPIAVWTGSTNLSTNALFGQLNVGHVINEPRVATAYLGYWTALAADPESDDIKDWSETGNLLPPPDEDDPVTWIFSPHRGRAVFDWWIRIADTAGKALFMTFPFGIVQDFRPVYDKTDAILRFALLDKYVNGGTPESRARAIADIERIRRRPNVGMALGHRIYVDWVDGWRKEHGPIGVHVDWVHTKFMLVDPLGRRPVTLTGSANWSESSVDENDENLLVIRGDRRVADIYFGEFMRIFAHHRFRESVARHIEQFGSAAFDTWKPQDLLEDWRKWVPTNFKAGSEHDIKRRYFVGE